MSLRKGLEKLSKDGNVSPRIAQTRNTSLSNTALQLQKHSEDLDTLFKRVEELSKLMSEKEKPTSTPKNTSTTKAEPTVSKTSPKVEKETPKKDEASS